MLHLFEVMPVRKPQRSIRLSGEAEKILGCKVVRVTLNPILLSLSGDYVDWSGSERGSGKLRASDLVLKARGCFPEFPPIKPYRILPKHVRRFSILSPAEKIRVGERW